MGPTRLAILIVAAVCSIGLAFIVFNMMSGQPAPAAPVAAPVAAGDVTMQKVLVAKRDLKIGERITAQDVAWQPWPPTAVNETFITDGEARPMPSKVGAATEVVLDTVLPDSAAMAAVDGAIVREAIFKSEPIVQRKLVRGGEGGFMSVMLQPGMRAFSVPVTVESGAGGFILPNDHVDLILNQKIQMKSGDGSDGADIGVSKVIMRNLRVLAIDQTTEPEKGARSLVGAVATLEVPAENVEAVAAAKTQGELVLSLRAYSDALGGPRRAYAETASSDVIRVYRSGQASDVRVAQ